MKSTAKKWRIILGVIIVLVFSINSILSVVISNIVNTQLEEINNQGKLHITVGKINLNVFVGNLNLKNVSVKSDSLFFDNFKQGNTQKASTSEFMLSDLKIRGFGIYDILVNKKIYARKIIANGLQLNLYKSDKHLNKTISDSNDKKSDSLFIKGINEIDFNSIVFDDFEFRIINAQSADTIFSYKEKECEITGIDLIAHPTIENYFIIDKENLIINFDEQEINTNDGNYKIVLNKIKYEYKTSSLLLANFKMNPTTEKAKLASTYIYNSEVYNFETDIIQLKGFHLDSILRTGIVKLDTVLIENPTIGIYKDQTKPFNLHKRPKFLNQTLKALNQPLHIEKVLIQNGLFSYWEKHEGFNELMTLDITDLNAEISNVTSLKENLTSGSNLTMNIQGKLSKVAPFKLDILMHYNTWNNSFSFKGSVGEANFVHFNPAIFPAAGVKFDDGKLQSMNFTVHGTPAGSNGKMTMLYHNISANFIKEHKKKKTISWIGNTLIVESNPSKRGNLRVAEIEFERVPYKGFGNLLWKSVMSGMVNTINPLGKHEKHKIENEKVSKVKHTKRKHKI
ncbi:hypothetical protein SAMN06265371_102458 [Lutibacter agarilyticus]|uniref:AsmA-like C-terminal region n=1 Tax=Lutibacter agarilyticus TaxID=1109740 RepID=A0A238W5V1_9FLAO|nr:hypothetical protein [Lutibacter agarilyticus]SNR41932.1 hypothetical protein SAMN06265371_102458 [Lutibacter agarilyticus]